MQIDLQFKPDVIIHLLKNKSTDTFYLNSLWGERAIYDYGRDYIHSLLKGNKDCFFFTIKGLGKYKIIEGVIDES